MKDYVLIISIHADPALPPGYNEWGGTHTYMRELLIEFCNCGIPCILVTRKTMAELPDVEFYSETCVVYRIVSDSPKAINKTKLRYLHDIHLEQIKGIIRAQESVPRIIHSVYWNSGRLALELSKQNGIPFVHSVISNSRGRVYRGAYEPIEERADFEQQIYDSATWVICVSEDEANDLSVFYNVPHDKIVVAGQYIHGCFVSPSQNSNNYPRINSHIDNCTQQAIAQNHQLLSPNTIGDDYWSLKSFLYIGRMDENKGVVQIVLAWHELFVMYKELCPSLWLVGGSLSEIEAIRRKIKEHIHDLPQVEQQQKVIWWGCLDSEGLSTVLLKASVLITHSLYEPGGRVCIEAMSEGVPVIATPNGFAKDAIQNWREGFLVEHNDIRALSIRMNHFIRQPYLSNSMGHNARVTAERVINEWDFWEKHLFCYGLSGQQSPPLLSHVHQNYFDRRYINLYPHCNYRYSEELVINLFTEHTGFNVVSTEDNLPGMYPSEILRIESTYGTYYSKRYYTRLAISPLFNPVLSSQYVRRADKHFHVEIENYRRNGCAVLVAADKIHFMTFFKALDPYVINNRDDLIPCFKYLATRKNVASDFEVKRYLEILSRPISSLSDIEKIFHLLSTELIDYYFEVSAVFSNQLAWALAPYLIEHNKYALDPHVCSILRDYIGFFSKLAQKNAEKVRDINTDIEIKHLKLYMGQMEMIDREKTSMGSLETDIASLLFDYVLNYGIDGHSFWDWVAQSIREYDLCMVDILSSLAYRLFYEIIIQNTLHLQVPELCIDYIASIYQYLRGGICEY